MKSTRSLILMMLVALAGPAAAAQELTDDQIKEAITLGTAGKSVTSDCYAKSGFLDITEMNGGFTAYVEGPYGRIMRLAREAKKKYLPFGLDTVTPDMRAGVVTVTATPEGPSLGSGEWHRTPPASHLVLKTKPPKGQEPIVLPATKIASHSGEYAKATTYSDLCEP